MKWRLQLLSVFATVLLAVRMMAQDMGGGAGGAGAGGGAGGDASGAMGSGASGAGGEGTTTYGGENGGGATQNNGGTGGNQNGTGTPLGAGNGGATGEENGAGGGSTPAPTPAAGGGGGLFGNGTETTGTSGNFGPVLPGITPSAPAGGIPGFPGSTPLPSPAGGLGAGGSGAQSQQQSPVTLSLPGGYGGSPGQTFTLGEGRLARPPITFSVNVSQGYDDNIFSADSHIVAGPTPTPLPTLFERIPIGFRITPPFRPTVIFKTVKIPPSPTPAPAKSLGVVGSPVSTMTLGIQIQNGNPRTVITSDASVGVQDYWNQPGKKEDYTGNFDLSLVHRITSRATLSISAFAVYQATPNFALINAPTANNTNGGDYLNGNAKIDLSYTWSNRFSTVTSYALDFNLPQQNSIEDVYENSYGMQFRYSVSARATVTAEARQTIGTYPSIPAADSISTYYLLGLDTIISARLRTTFSGGLESHSNTNGGSAGNNKTLPYFESATTLALPRGAGLTWTNRYGSEETQSQTQTIESYRTGLTYSEPLSTKLSLSLSLAYNNIAVSDSTPGGSSTQNQVQTGLSFAYTVSPRLSLSLSYNYFNLMNTQVNSSYVRQQIYLGGNYTFY